MNTTNYPIILVFYLDSDLMKNPQIIQPFAESVNNMLALKNANALAFFLPTKGEERITCINPIMIKEADMAEISKLIEDIKKSFSVGVDMNLPNEDITIEKPKEDGSTEM